jgi:hypothetical protein
MMSTGMKIPKFPFGPVWFAMPGLLALWYVWTSVDYPVDFWHCVTQGRLIAQTGPAHVRDAYTFTIAGEELLEQPWLARLAIGRLFEWGGYAAAQCVAGLLYAGGLSAVTALVWRRTGNVRVAAGLGVLAFALAVSNFSVRTQAISVPLLAAELYVLWRWPGRYWTLGAVGLVEVLWTNTHGAFPLGVVVPGLFWASVAIERWRAGGFRGLLADRVLGCYFGCLLVALGAMFANPRPDQTMNYVLGVASKSSARDIGEWAATGAASFSGTAFFLSVVFVLIVLALSPRRLPTLELLLLVSFALLGFQAQRMVIWWALVIGPVIGPSLAELLASRRKGPASEEDPSAATLLIVFALLAMTAFSTPWTRRWNPMLPAAKRRAYAANEPREVVAFLRTYVQESKSEDRPWRVYSTMEWGSYLTCFLDPRLKVFLDSRVDFFPDEIWDAYIRIGTVRSDWRELLAKYGVQMIVWNRRLSDELPTALENSPTWRSVYQDDLAAVFVRGDARRDAPASPGSTTGR